jgi:hypothetical protein
MKQIIFIFALFISFNINAQTNVKNKITVTIAGKSVNIQTKKSVILKDGYYVETVIPKTLEEITKSMILQEGKYKYNNQDYKVFATNKGILYALIETEKGFIRIKIGKK